MFWIVTAFLTFISVTYLFYNVDINNKNHKYKVYGLMAFSCITALSLYLYLGKADMPDFPYIERQDVKNIDLPHDIKNLPLDTIIHKIEQRLANNPEDKKGHLVLAQINAKLGKFAHALTSYEKYFSLTKKDIHKAPSIWGDYAEVMILNNDNIIGDRAHEIYSQILSVDKNNMRAYFFILIYNNQQNNTSFINTQCQNISLSDNDIWSQRIQLLCNKISKN